MVVESPNRHGEVGYERNQRPEGHECHPKQEQVARAAVLAELHAAAEQDHHQGEPHDDRVQQLKQPIFRPARPPREIAILAERLKHFAPQAPVD